VPAASAIVLAKSAPAACTLACVLSGTPGTEQRVFLCRTGSGLRVTQMEKLVPGNGRTFLSDFLGSFARVFHRRTVVPHRNTFSRPEYAGAESPRVVDQSRVNLLIRQSGKHESGSIATTICGRSIGTTGSPASFPFWFYRRAVENTFDNSFWPINCDAGQSGEDAMRNKVVRITEWKITGSRAHGSLAHRMLGLFSNLSAFGRLLTSLTLGAMLKSKETRARHPFPLLWLGISFGAFAALCCFCLVFLHLPPVAKSLLPLGGLWLPLAWSYTFPRIEEGRQVARARDAVTGNKPQRASSYKRQRTASELPPRGPESMQQSREALSSGARMGWSDEPEHAEETVALWVD